MHRAALGGERHHDTDVAVLNRNAVDQSQINNIAAEFGIDHLAKGLEYHRLSNLIHVGVGTLTVPIVKGFSLGLKRCPSIPATLITSVVTAKASRTHPIRTPVLLEQTMPPELTTIPPRKAQ